MDKSKKVMLTIASSILILIAVSAVGFFVWYQYMNANYYLGHGSLHAEKVANIAIQKNNPNECAKIKVLFPIMELTEQEVIRECYFRMAHLTNDENVCNYISGETYKNICIKDIGASRNDITSCERISDQLDKGSCYKTFTEQGTDMSVCENISTDSGIKLSGRDLCYIGAVQAKPDISICTTKIKSEHYRNQCYKAVAMATKNPVLCDKMQGQYIQFDIDDCKRYIRETSN